MLAKLRKTSTLKMIRKNIIPPFLFAMPVTIYDDDIVKAHKQNVYKKLQQSRKNDTRNNEMSDNVWVMMYKL